MAIDDDEIEGSCVQDQALSVGGKRAASERKKILNIFSREAVTGKKG